MLSICFPYVFQIVYSENSTTASISVIESNGRQATPTATLECFPFSPNTSKNRSDAGLMTLGCCVKFGMEFTNPESFTIFVTLSKLPISLFIWAIILIAHILADFCAISKLSSETFPVKITFPSSIGIWPEINSRFPVRVAGTYDPAGVGGFGSLTPIDSSFSSIKILMLDFSLILVFRNMTCGNFLDSRFDDIVCVSGFDICP